MYKYSNRFQNKAQEKGFVPLYLSACKTLNITPLDWCILVRMHGFGKDSYASEEFFAWRFRVATSTARKAIKKLVSLGMIYTPKAAREGKRNKTNVYRISQKKVFGGKKFGQYFQDLKADETEFAINIFQKPMYKHRISLNQYALLEILSKFMGEKRQSDVAKRYIASLSANAGLSERNIYNLLNDLEQRKVEGYQHVRRYRAVQTKLIRRDRNSYGKSLRNGVVTIARDWQRQQLKLEQDQIESIAHTYMANLLKAGNITEAQLKALDVKKFTKDNLEGFMRFASEQFDWGADQAQYEFVMVLRAFLVYLQRYIRSNRVISAEQFLVLFQERLLATLRPDDPEKIPLDSLTPKLRNEIMQGILNQDIRRLHKMAA